MHVQAGYAPDGDLLVGVDVGGTKVAVLAVGPDDTVVGRCVRPVPTDPGTNLVDLLLSAIVAAVADVPGGLERIRAVGLAFPGRVQPESGHVRQAANLAWVDQPIGPQLADAIGRPCVLENDVRAAALGILRHGGPLASPDMAYLNVGTGIAAGIVVGGRLQRGRHGMAGEVGHIVLDPQGAVCGCGLAGCVEALVSGPAIARTAVARVPRDVLLASGGATTPTPSALYAAAAAGDPSAVAVVRETSAVIARVVHGLVMAYDLERVVIGGGVSKIGLPFIEGIEAELDRFRQRSALAREMLGPGVLRLVPADFDAGCWGAVALADGLDPAVPGDR